MHAVLFGLDNRSEYCLEGKRKKKKRHKIENFCVSREVRLKRHEGKIAKKGGDEGCAWQNKSKLLEGKAEISTARQLDCDSL